MTDEKRNKLVNWLYCFVFDTEGENAEEKRESVVRRLIRAGLQVEQFYSVQRDEIFVKVGATDERLLHEAENAEFELLLNQRSLRDIAKGTDKRVDLIRDRTTGKVVREIVRHRKPLNLERTGKQFVRKEESDKPKTTTTAVSTRVDLIEESVKVQMKSISETSVLKLQGKLTPYDLFEFIYAPYDEDYEQYFLHAHDRQIYETYADGSILSGAARMKLIHMAIERSITPDPRTGSRGAGLSMPQLVASEIVMAWFPVHQETTCNAEAAGSDRTITTVDLVKKWANFGTLPWRQPLDIVRAYFGEKVALYFAFLGHYSLWLAVPSLLGFAVFVHQMYNVAIGVTGRGGTDVTVDVFNLAAISVVNGTVTDVFVFTEVPELPYYAAFISLWATVMLEFWKRREALLAMKWGTSSFESTESVRVEFKPQYELPSIVTGEPESYYPWRTQMLKFAMSIAVLTISLISVFTVFLLLALAARLIESLEDEENQFSPTTLQAITFSALFVDGATKIVMGNLYAYIAVKLNDWENHRTDTRYEDSLILKTFVFEFVNRYGTLFYLAFVKKSLDVVGITDFCIPLVNPSSIQDLPGVESIAPGVSDNCFGTVGYALLAAFGSSLIVNNTMEVFGPAMKNWFTRRSNLKVATPTDEENQSENHILIKSPCEDDYFLQHYESTLDDYLELAIQFGYCTMFVASFPLAPFLAFANNYLETWVDSHKLCTLYRRPEVQGAQDIGPWQQVFEVMGVFAVCTNMAVILYSTNIYTFAEDSHRVWAYVISVLTIFLVKYMIAAAVPDVPGAVRIQLERTEFLTRKILKREPDDDDDDDDDFESMLQSSTAVLATIHDTDPGVQELMGRVSKVLREMVGSRSLRGLFEQIDSDGSGEIDSKEFIQILREKGKGITEYDARKLVLALDADGDGQIDYKEFIDFMESMQVEDVEGPASEVDVKVEFHE